MESTLLYVCYHRNFILKYMTYFYEFCPLRFKKLFHKTTSGSTCGGCCCLGGEGKGGSGTNALGSGGSSIGGGGADAFGWGDVGGGGDFGGTLFSWGGPTIALAAGSPAAGLAPVIDGEVAEGAKEDESSSWYNGSRSVTFCRCFRNDVMLFRMSIRTINLFENKN